MSKEQIKLKQMSKKHKEIKNLFDNNDSIMSLIIPDALKEEKDKLYLGANRYTRNLSK